MHTAKLALEEAWYSWSVNKMYPTDIPIMKKMVIPRINFCFLADRFSFRVLNLPGHRYMMNTTRDIRFPSSRASGSPTTGISPTKFESTFSPFKIGNTPDAKLSKKFLLFE